MHFGLKHAPSKFQKVMDSIFKPYFDWLLVYIDDILIFSKNIQDHFQHVQTFVQLVKRNGLVLSKKKIEVFTPDRGGRGGDMQEHNGGRKVAMQATTKQHNYTGCCDGLQVRKNSEE